jgi:hypothetical protein
MRLLPGPHDDSGLPTTRRVPIDLSKFDPEMDFEVPAVRSAVQLIAAKSC